MEYYITIGGHRDISRLYPMMQFDFGAYELFSECVFHRALRHNAIDFLLLQNSEGLEVGYALIQKKSMYGYVLLAYISVYPTMRGKGLGEVFLDLLKQHYAYSQGILLEVTCPEGKEQKRDKLVKLYSQSGWEVVECDYKLNGVDATLMNLALRGPRDITPAVRRIVPDLYEPYFTGPFGGKRVDIKKR